MNPAVRPATDSELKKWRSVIDLSERIHGQMYAAQLKNANVAEMYKWGAERKQPITNPATLELTLNDIGREYDLLRNAIQKVEDREWGIYFGPTGKISIFSPLTEQSGFSGGWIIPVLLAIIAAKEIIPNIVEKLQANMMRQMDLIEELDKWRTASQKVFCGEGSNPEICEDWKGFLQESDIVKREEESESILDKIGKGAAKGLSWGIGIAIALGALLIASSLKK